MLVVQDAFHSSDLPRGGVGAIGNFDGLHRGHRAILERTVARARELAVSSVAVTFEPHPRVILKPEQAPLPLSTPEQKERLLAEAGVAVLLVVRFTPEFSQIAARDFVRDFLAGRLALAEIFVGSSFHFGHGRKGNLALLREMGEGLGFRAFGVEEVLYKGERISSSRVRQALAEGRVDDAREMLGRPYAISGKVVRGDRMGRKLGWPTVNLASDNELLPADGVYVSRVCFPSYPATFDSVTNIGTRPTVYESYQRVVESHILDFSADVYDERLELRFLKRLREERAFPSVMDLAAQIGRDVEVAREYFQRHRPERLEPAAPSEPPAEAAS
ncbi:MAG TPA: bifunctional riboflavin kinase/FAD synthetase [Thermoanaerobaculia bacterium]|nr:bifunctional riboflavin kinase/FAD synthetase [Thermoanaerobaculia bacterium]